MASVEIDENSEVKNAGGKERRRSRRIVCDMFVEAIVDKRGTMFRGTIKDISQTGCYIETRAKLNLERQTRVDIRFMVEKSCYNTTAQVMDVRPGRGVGLKFVLEDEHTEEWIRELIEALIVSGFPDNG